MLLRGATFRQLYSNKVDLEARQPLGVRLRYVSSKVLRKTTIELTQRSTTSNENTEDPNNHGQQPVEYAMQAWTRETTATDRNPCGNETLRKENADAGLELWRIRRKRGTYDSFVSLSNERKWKRRGSFSVQSCRVNIAAQARMREKETLHLFSLLFLYH